MATKEGKVPFRVFFCTDASVDVVTLLETYAERWGIEVFFREAKQQLGFADSSARKETAVRRVAPFVGLLYTILVIWFLEGASNSPLATPPIRPWYTHKRGLCFADIIRTARRAMIGIDILDLASHIHDLHKWPGASAHPSGSNWLGQQLSHVEARSRLRSRRCAQHTRPGAIGWGSNCPTSKRVLDCAQEKRRNKSPRRIDVMGVGIARQVVGGRSYLFTRRCAQRQFLLRADAETNEAVVYCLGVAAQRYGVELHSVTAMSNHLAITGLDVRGDYPGFLQYLHSLIARCVNVVRSRWENFWSSDEPSKVELLDAKAVLDKMVYNLTDPVRQNLVDKVHNWPGVSSLGYQLADKPMKAKRPRKFFRKDGAMPDEVTLRFERPPEFMHMSHEAWVELLQSRVRAVEQHAAEERQAKGLRIMGRKAVLRQSPFSSPRSMAPRRNLSPKVAAGARSVRIAALQRIKRFQQHYREALADVARGITGILFPYGSYQLVKLGLVRSEPPPT